MPQIIRVLARITAIAFLFAALAQPVLAQNTGVIEGTITDEQGGVMPGVSVTLRNVETGAERTVVTEADGRYRFPGLQSGTYNVNTSLQGFASEEIRNIVVTIGL